METGLVWESWFRDVGCRFSCLRGMPACGPRGIPFFGAATHHYVLERAQGWVSLDRVVLGGVVTEEVVCHGLLVDGFESERAHGDLSLHGSAGYANVVVGDEVTFLSGSPAPFSIRFVVKPSSSSYSPLSSTCSTGGSVPSFLTRSQSVSLWEMVFQSFKLMRSSLLSSVLARTRAWPSRTCDSRRVSYLDGTRSGQCRICPRTFP